MSKGFAMRMHHQHVLNHCQLGPKNKGRHVLSTIILLLALIVVQIESLASDGGPAGSSMSKQRLWDRRHVLGSAVAAGLVLPGFGGHLTDAEAAVDKGGLLTLSHTAKRGMPVRVPCVGYSFYKTDSAMVGRCLNLALAAGVRHLDVATLYNSNAQIGVALQKYLETGLIPLEPIKKGDDPPPPKQVRGNSQRRRQQLFISHKVSNMEQSLDRANVKASVKSEMEKLGVSYLDLCSIHSPLADSKRRMATYEALLELQQEGLVQAVGVCNYGVGPLNEITSAGLPPPSVNQLELSPFNQHKDVAQWAKEHDTVLSCGAWSKLSGVSGPQEGWTVLADIAKKRGLTKAQVLVRWSLQKGFVCVPRSGAASKAERIAIFENSYVGCKAFVLTQDEMTSLDLLDEGFKAGKLGRRDGWGDKDVTGDDWEPTNFV